MNRQEIIKAESDIAMLFMSGKEHSNCLGFRIVMKDDIDGKLLQQAVNSTMKRYSYLNVRLVEKIKPYYVKNDSPYTVSMTKTVKELGGKETNYHLIWFTYYEKTIRICFSHILVDGQGINEVAKTLIYYYCKLRYDKDLSSEGIVTLETPVHPNETVDVYNLDNVINVKADKRIYKKHFRKPESGEPGKFFSFAKSSLIHPDKSISKCYYIKVLTEQFMELCKTNDISPSVLVSLFIADTIRKLHPDSGYITCGLAMSVRKTLNCPETVRNSVLPLKLRFNQKMKEMSFDMQCTAVRGQVVLATDETIQCNNLKKYAGIMKALSKIPYIRLTKKLFSNAMSSIMKESYQVSYLGQSKMGEAEKYIDYILFDFDMPASGINVEMTSSGNNIMICFGQKWEEDIYLNTFLDILHEHGIKTELIEKSIANVPGMYSILY